MKILLDTHAVLWALLSPNLLSPKAARAIADVRYTILVSAASAWEIATKLRFGKLPGAEAFELEFLESLDDAGYLLISIEVEHALRAGRLTGSHGNPFDKMIAAQALSFDIPVVSSDAKLDSFVVRRIW